MRPPKVDDYLAALEKMKKSRRDRIGVLGELGVTGIGAAAGWFAAAVIGAKVITVFGIGITVAATPIGWVIGSAALAGGAAYGIAGLVRGGGKYDTLKELSIRELEQRIEQLSRASKRSLGREPKMKNLISSLQLLVANGRLSQDETTDLLAAVEKGHVTINVAFEQIKALAETTR
ncbi:MAG: hypothetical protein IPF50_00915 [Proteobacteria bacterium]|nr:hypothetical protein [Pseudomonadota bacterium]MBP6107323.1 hypothetical protein [Steroidobacteraceae bacterium]MBP7014533.1 hypothetical protein [Steroidobacteraceae bacterium]